MILVTGSTGFVGTHLIRELAARNIESRILRHTSLPFHHDNCEHGFAGVRETSRLSVAKSMFSDIDCVIHCAGLAHAAGLPRKGHRNALRKANVDYTRNVAVAAAIAGVKRFIFVSSVKVFGENSPSGKPFAPDDAPSPISPYGQSKLEAELSLLEIQSETGMEVVIVRPPMVYGSGAKGNYDALVKILKLGCPLPLAACTNLRSFVAVGNLTDFLVHCSFHPNASGQIFCVSDGDDISSAEFVSRVAHALGRDVHLFSVPEELLKIVASTVGLGGPFSRLYGALQVDIKKSRERIAWKPPFSMVDGLRVAVRYSDS